MYVIQIFDDYWFRDAGDRIEEIHDLEAATQFKTKTAAKALVASTTFSEFCEIKKLADVLPYFLEWKKNGMVRREIPKITEVSRKYNNENLEEVIAFHKYHREHEHEIRHEDWRTWPNVGHFLECFYDMQHYTDGNRELMTTFKLKVSQTAEYKTFKRELELLIPHITYIDDDGFATMSIFDHECSEYESRYLLFNKKKNKHHIRNHRGNELFSGTLKQCFDRIRQTYYYE